MQAHVQNGTGLNLAEVELVHQAVSGLFRRLAGTNQRNDLVDVVQSNDQALQNVCALLRFVQVELRATHHHIVAVVDVVRHHLLEVQQLRSPFDKRDVVD